MKFIRIAIILLTTAVIGWMFSSQIRSLNIVKSDGQTVFMDLRPVDPRALMLGDYMRLRYAEERLPEGLKVNEIPPKGAFIMTLDANNVATFNRLDDGVALGPNEIKINYTRTNRSVTFGAPRFYFENGTAEDYEPARYGVFKVDKTGRAILVNLADDNRQIIKPKPQ